MIRCRASPNCPAHSASRYLPTRQSAATSFALKLARLEARTRCGDLRLMQLEPPPGDVYVLVGDLLARLRLYPLGLEPLALELYDHRILPPGACWVRGRGVRPFGASHGQLLLHLEGAGHG